MWTQTLSSCVITNPGDQTRVLNASPWKKTWVDGFAHGHVRMVVGSARIRLACESMRIANPYHRCSVPTPRRKRYGTAIRTISRRLVNHCRICAKRIRLACESMRIANPHHRFGWWVRMCTETTVACTLRHEIAGGLVRCACFQTIPPS